LAAASRRHALREAQKNSPAFAPVVVEERLVVKEAPITPAVPSGSGMIEIVIGVATVRVASGTDSASLQAVLRAVMAVR
jgi:hypothetical protein